MYRASFVILYCDQQMLNYFTNYHTPTFFDTIVSSSGSLRSVSYQDTQVFQMQLLVIQFTIKKFYIGFMQVLIFYIYIYTGCNKRNGPDFGRVFLMLYYTDIIQNTYVQT